MTTPFSQSSILILTLTLTLTAACGGGDAGPNGGGKATGAGPCDVPSQCAGDVCVAIIDDGHPPVYCSEECTATSCPSGFYCDTATFALVGKTFCRFGTLPPGENPPPPVEPPRLPCMKDTDCDGGEVCANSGGYRDCTLPCTTESQCTPPALGGISFDFFACKADDDGRHVCLPDPACYANPLSCTNAPL